ncbi:tyrosine recombinase XerC [Leptothrix discophora]|uniref:Tyrosine recombinase XerC n=1 Tax=Leptothrix discophora TaxID=89 RepID=A0ABT9G7D7_LEPDI|nr:tyrosine recombinase XerC [Leptothrix discophora]MDP4302392.1 tyrosine recombinase XerC [Leptothrix discophora]
MAPAEDTPPVPLGPVPTAFLEHLRVERRLAERTRTMYGGALRRLQASMAEQALAFDQVRPHHVRRWAAQLHGQGLGSRSIAIHLAAWRGLYRWLGRGGRVTSNPVDGLRPPKGQRPLPKALPIDQAVALADHHDEAGANDPLLEARDHALTELLYGCGLRSAELLGLDLLPGGPGGGWIDLDSGDAEVLGKGSKRRVVPVGSAALVALRAWLALRPNLARADEPALFVSRRGTRLTDSQLRRRLAARAVQAGLSSHVHPHMLRHSYASHLLQSSGDLRAVQELLGHAQISTTQVYTRLDHQHLAKIYDAAHPRARRKT